MNQTGEYALPIIGSLPLREKTASPPNSGRTGISEESEVNNKIELALMTTEKEERIYSKWMGSLEKITDQENHRILWKIIGGISLCVLFFLFCRLMLNRVVRLHTKDLLKEVEERKQAEKALKESEMRFKALAETSPLAIYMSEEIDQKCLYLNSRFTELFGYTIDEIPTASHWWPLAYPDPEYRQEVVGKWQKDIAKAIETHSDIETRVTEVCCKDGTKKIVSWGFITLGEQNWSFGLDLTEQIQAEENKKALEAQLSQSQKMEAVGTLAGGIAHDFNNILTAILGYADLTLLDLSNESRVRYQIEQIMKAGFRARDLVKQILYYSRKDSSQCQSVYVFEIIQEDLKLIRASIPSTIRIEEDLDPQCGNTLADPTQIHQIMMNLCTNAAQAMDEKGGVLTVRLSTAYLSETELKDDPSLTAGPYILLQIEDNGTGIKNRDIHKIFDPYFTTKEVGKGSGMGLAVVAGILKNINAGIRLDSSFGTGTSIKIYFPRVESHPIEPKQEDSVPIGGSEKILIVDDEDSILEITRRSLEGLGYEVTARKKSVEALELFASSPNDFDLIITDQTMPDLTGENLALEALKIRPEIPIVLCTGYSSHMNKEKALSIGLKGFIMKPYDMKEFLGSIRDILDQKGKTALLREGP
ncbi:response regulator [Oceanispirochaeta crateris]|uniref:histidine kinase n=1 Tax=Oceanispirochaeta crateris TaxID=2518645 RepID=A0A5C1QGV8_9SPIO|nr:response regulator [Oceanispirochaeta crateris]QEN06548.1 response regulator [Oceanispirochaeta crateris]